MIYAIVGRPRSGKSYESVAFHIIPAIKKGRKVITNVSVNIDFFVKVFGEEVRELLIFVDGQLDQFGRMDRPFSKFEHYNDEWRDDNGVGPLYLIDEAHMVLPNKQLDSKILEFYSLHGHYGIDIILITQNLRKIHRDIKDMIELTYYCAKNTSLGSENSYTKKVRIGCTNEVVNQEFRKYKKDVFPFYKSHTQSSKDVIEAESNDVKAIWKSPKMWLSPVLIISGILIFYFYSGLFTSTDSEAEPVVTQEELAIEDESTTQETKAPEEKARKNKKKDPLSPYSLFVSGEALQIARDSNKQPIRLLSFKNYYIDVYDKDFKLFTLTQHDLVRIGYEFRVLSDCVFSATFEGSSRLITCGDYQEQQKNVNKFASAL